MRVDASHQMTQDLCTWLALYCTPGDRSAEPRRDGGGITAFPRDKHVISIVHVSLLSTRVFMLIKEPLQTVKSQRQSSVIRHCG